jgi:hypothetical protein
VRVVAVFSGQSYFNSLGLLAGAGVRAGGDHRYGLGWSADVVGQHAGANLNLGRISVDGVSIGAQMVYHRSWLPESRRLTARVGAGVRVAAVRLGGSTDSAGTTSTSSSWAATFGPMGSACLSLRLGPRLVLEAMAEGGYASVQVVPTVDGEPRPSATVGGGWLGFQLGLGVHL